MFEPWIGDSYAQNRLLLLGESTYEWEENGETLIPEDTHSRGSVETAIDGLENSSVFMTKLSRALTGQKAPSSDAIKAAWHRVAFTNYVRDVVGKGAGIRPTQEMWHRAEQQFPDLIRRIRPAPAKILVLGKELWRRMPPTAVYLLNDVQAYKFEKSTLCYCLAVEHPSRGMSWERLSDIIHFMVGAKFPSESRRE